MKHERPEDDEFDVLLGLNESQTAAMNEDYETPAQEKSVQPSRQPISRPKAPSQVSSRQLRLPQGPEAEMLARVEEDERLEEEPVVRGKLSPRLGLDNDTEVVGRPDVAKQRADDLDQHHRTQREIESRQNSELKRALGSLFVLLRNPAVCDIWRNPDGALFVNEHGVGVYQLHKDDELTDDQVMSLIGTVASLARIETDAKHPYVETMLPRGQARFSAVMPPYTNAGPQFALRRPGDQIKTLDEYLHDGSITRAQITAIRKAIKRRDNILIVGGTGSGKTTFANAIFAEIADADEGPGTRFLILEDTPELRCPAVNVVHYQTGPEMDMTSLLARCMRQSPTNISIGELRGKEAHVLVKAWNTGHSGGITTVHAPNARGALTRLESLIAESGNVATKQEISDAVNLIVVIKKDGKGRRTVTEVRRLTTPSATDYSLIDA